MVNPDTLKKEIIIELKKIDLEIMENRLENEKIVNNLEEIIKKIDKEYTRSNIDEFISSLDETEESNPLKYYLIQIGYIMTNISYLEKELEGLIETKEKIADSLEN